MVSIRYGKDLREMSLSAQGDGGGKEGDGENGSRREKENVEGGHRDSSVSTSMLLGR